MPTDENAQWVWLIVGTAVVGLLLGLRFKVASVVAASGIIVAIDCIASLVGHWSFQTGAMLIIASLFAIQLGYVLGLVIASRACDKS